MILEKQEYKVGIRYGIVLGIIVVSIGIIRYTTGMIFNEDQSLSYLYWVIFFVANLIAVISFKDSNNNRMSLGRAIKIGITIGFISSSIYLLYLIVLNYFIDPELPEKLIEISRQKMMEQNTELTPDQIKELEFKESSSTIVRGVIYVALSTIFGIIYSGIGGVVVKLKNKKR